MLIVEQIAQQVGNNERALTTWKANLPGITWILGIDKVKRWEETNIHGCVNAMPQSIHVLLVKFLGS